MSNRRPAWGSVREWEEVGEGVRGHQYASAHDEWRALRRKGHDRQARSKLSRQISRFQNFVWTTLLQCWGAFILLLLFRLSIEVALSRQGQQQLRLLNYDPGG